MRLPLSFIRVSQTPSNSLNADGLSKPGDFNSVLRR
jgi:hypothetical protein